MLGVRLQRISMPAALVLALVLIASISPPLSAQTTADEHYHRGVAAYRTGSPEAALPDLESAFAMDRAFVGAYGSAGMWLARAIDAVGGEGAQRVRFQALEALERIGAIDGALIDDTILALDVSEDVPSILERSYLRLLRQQDDPAWKRQATLTAVLLDDEQRADVIARRMPDLGALQEFRDGASDRLVRWWEARDPLPASAGNERLAEHLRRMAVAYRDYPDTTRVIGLDDRGLLYLRLGPPRHVRVVSFDDARFFLDVVRFGVGVGPRDFPRNEIWLYPHIDRAVYHVFAQDHRRRFRTTTPTELLPRRLQNAALGTDRQMNMAVSALAALRHIYRSLSLVHADFGPLHNTIEEYAMWQEERRMARMAGGPLEVGEVEYRVGSGATSVPVFVNPIRAIAPPNEFVRSSVTESVLNDERARRARERVEPDQHFDLYEALGVDRLEASVRASRFRRDDGTTRVVIDWAPRTDALQLSSGLLGRLEESKHEAYRDAFIRYTAMGQEDGGYPDRLASDSIAVMTGDAPNGVLLPRSLVIDRIQGARILVMQIDRFAADVRADPSPYIDLGPLVQVGTWRSEYEPLPPSGFVVSDVRPHFSAMGPEVVIASTDELATSSPFPHGFAPSRGSLILEFETYGLSRDSENRTHYAIEYEVERREHGGTFRRLLGRQRSDVSAARTEHRGVETSTRERILLDPAEWADGAEIRITLRVTDLLRGLTISRRLDFQS